MMSMILSVKMEDFKNQLSNLDLGAKYGLSQASTISSENLQRIISGAESGNRDNLYFLGTFSNLFFFICYLK